VGAASAQVWNSETGEQLSEFAADGRGIVRAALSSDGSRAVVVTADGSGWLYDAVSGERIATLTAERERGEDLDLDQRLVAIISPDDRYALTVSDERLARLWDTKDGHPLSVLRGHASYVASAAFSPDSHRVVTGSWDGSVRIWNVDTGDEVAKTNLPGRVTAAVFSPDGMRIIAGTSNGAAHAFRVFPTTQDLVDYARSIMPRDLTPEQRREFFLE
jgi:WD40 repeat protein